MNTDLYNKTFLTERTALVPISQTDCNFIFELVNTVDWKKYIGDRNITSITDAKNYIKKIQDLPNTYFWTIKETQTQKPMGIITLMKRSNFDFFDLGFAFLDDFKNKGFAFEASEGIIKFIKQDLQLQTIYAITLPENLNSIKLLKKLAFSLQKEFTENEEKLLLYQLQLDQY